MVVTLEPHTFLADLLFKELPMPNRSIQFVRLIHACVHPAKYIDLAIRSSLVRQLMPQWITTDPSDSFSDHKKWPAL
ncbi:hypothetical protein GCM10023213_36150 [Prosthecobacter algae]|uniref:Uncharacterized protein n=1 Tax=Prosthecobacter algae TaxID=1144682 RepID=A0ABP9PDX0_9BACT